jgi:hypothetical protein
MRIWRSIAMLLFAACLAGEAAAQNTISNLPREETLIVENPEGTIKNAGWFNIWAINAGGQSTGLHQLGMDTFWYIDPQKGVDGVWDNSLGRLPRRTRERHRPAAPYLPDGCRPSRWRPCAPRAVASRPR